MADSGDFHERVSATSADKYGSNRSFGIVFGVVFAAIAVFLWWHASRNALYFAIASAALFVIAYTAPLLLAPANWLWIRFGLLLHKIISPVILFILFFLAVTPIGLLMRAFGRRPLHLNWDRKASSYWMERTPAGPRPGSLRNQF